MKDSGKGLGCLDTGLDTAELPHGPEKILVAAGYAHRDAWVRTEHTSSTNAVKQAKKRRKMLEGGLVQINVVAPEDCKAVFRQIAHRVKHGDPWDQVLADQIGVPLIPPHLSNVVAALLNQIRQGNSRADALRFLLAEELAGRLD